MLNIILAYIINIMYNTRRVVNQCVTNENRGVGMVKKILVYSTDHEVRNMLLPLLEHEKMCVSLVEEKQEIPDRLEQEDIHLAIVGAERGQKELLAEIELLSQIRRESPVPIIVISEEKSESIKIMMLNAGADDYIPADCSPLELLARINVQLRHYTQQSHIRRDIDEIYQIGELVIDDRYKQVMVNGRNVSLTPIEYKILKLLAQEQGRVISISQIYEAIWHMKAVGVDNTIAVHICHIREKIESNPKNPQYLKVVWGAGYKVG